MKQVSNQPIGLEQQTDIWALNLTLCHSIWLAGENRDSPWISMDYGNPQHCVVYPRQ